MKFTPIDSSNLAECVELFVEVFNSPPWNENWRAGAVAPRLEECVHTPNFYGIMAKMDGQCLGFALGYSESWDQSKHFYLKEMCVAANHQRSGIGAALMNNWSKA